jgi:transposase-like protein
MTLKEKIVQEYLAGAASLGALAGKYGVAKSTIYSWATGDKKEPAAAPPGELILQPMATKDNPEGMPGEIALLHKQLEEERLRNKLLTAVIDIAERDLKIPIRKKYGTKPSKK